ncbi:Glycosyltransferase involved in cell wall bisynthesis [Micromonospora pattaloongensis]|uniref:Glycosyltransferase involved in cell wall bisynthesis n=1 Tax=Micromonospora pattaloongensis TaxID=405436 RepID=A0A1H3SJ51_9ACTN|nr:glycosyltransferase family 4 protein [Micromonospora pattaloongensis]SDZ37992.1 Glycosyltransferase involved in cell wall bisynthesis [Micromonospora pattaloongensis]
MEPVPSSVPPTRGRVVMLVDNGVNGDSRVQKAARSAADAGWEVILLGIRGASPEETWRIGDAEVRLIKVARRLSHPVTYRRALLRRPLAYRPGRQANRRVQKMKVWRADLQFRLAEATAAAREGGSRWAFLATRARLAAPLVTATVLARWTKFRAGELTRLQQRQQDPTSTIDRLAMRFWQSTMGDRSWRRLDPELWDYEMAFGPVIDELKPDLIHANDFRMLGVGARAAMRARARGRRLKLVWDAHEFVPGIIGRPTNPRWLPAQIAYVREHAPYADAVMTVSPTLADLLREMHDLPEQPAVVLNAPPRTLTADQRALPVPDLRALCGVSASTPLLVYCGGINPSRGVDIMIRGLTELTDAHVALVSLHPNGKIKAMEELEELAAQLGVADRVHLLPYVPHWQVSRFLAPADLGVIPIHHKPNHELALITKFFEYAHARLPMVVSDVKTMAEATRATGQGEVFRAEDLTDYLRAVRAVLADPQRYRAAYDRAGVLDQWTWEAQARVMDEVYSRLLPDAPPSRLAEPTGAVEAVPAR